MTLVEFLEARLAAHERTVRDVYDVYGDDEWPIDLEGALREVAAKRAIVARCVRVLDIEGWEYDDAPTLALEVLADLASVYADHPDYDPAWAPEAEAVRG